MEYLEIVLYVLQEMLNVAGTLFNSVGLLFIIFGLIVAYNVFRLLLVPIVGQAIDTGLSDMAKKHKVKRVQRKAEKKRDARVKRAGKKVKR